MAERRAERVERRAERRAERRTNLSIFKVLVDLPLLVLLAVLSWGISNKCSPPTNEKQNTGV
jgi:hypothetical protein